MMADQTFRVRVSGDETSFSRSSTAAMVEVRGPDHALVDQRMVWVNAAPVWMRLGEPGPHAVRATLGSGRVLHEDLDYNGVTRPVVDFFLYGESPHETLERIATVHRMAGREASRVTAARYLSAWVRLWERRDGAWRVTGPDLDLDATEWNVDVVHHALRLAQRQYVLEVGAPGFGPVMACLPGMGTTEVAIRPISRPDRSVELMVVPASPEAATLLGFLGSGAVGAIESMLSSDEMVGRLAAGHDAYDFDDYAPQPGEIAELVLYRKLNDPNTAALGGYHLLRTGELERLHSWPANLADWMDWMSDGSIIRGWQLLRGGAPRRGETPRERFLEAAERGLPIFAEGLRLLIDGLKVIQRESPGDSEVARAIERLGRYAAVTDWSKAVLTFTGDGPDRPTGSSAPAARAGEPGTVLLHSMTVEDLVRHGLLLPGTRLHAQPRPARQVGAAWTDEVRVAGDGMLDSSVGAFSDPNEAAIMTERDLSDGWHTWSTPDGTSLDTLRHEARRRPPLSECEILAAPMADSGVPSRAVRLLANAGLTSVADLLAFGVDRVEAIPGIGPRTASDIRQALDERGLRANDG